MQNLLTPQANACNKKMILVPFSEQALWKTSRPPDPGLAQKLRTVNCHPEPGVSR
jgi:hypothetical protein